jgi:hypothetical protein
MKHLATLASYFFLALTSFAQTTDDSEAKVHLFANIENAYNSYQVRLDIVNEFLEAGAITEDSAQAWKWQLMENFQERLMEIAVDAGDQLWSEDGEEASVEPEEDTASAYAAVREANEAQGEWIEQVGEPDNDPKGTWKKRKRKFTGSGMNIGFAPYLMALDANQEFVPSDWLPETGTVSTVSWDLFFHQRRLGRTPLWLRSGLTWDFYTVDLGTHTYLTTDLIPGANGIYLMEDPSITFRNSALSTSYLTVPLWFYLNGSRTGRKGLSAAAGLYGGIRVGAPTRTLRYMDSNNGWTRERVNSRYYTNPLSAGVQLRIGYKKIHLTARQSVTPLFNPRLDIVRPDVYVASLALGWDWD